MMIMCSAHTPQAVDTVSKEYPSLRCMLISSHALIRADVYSQSDNISFALLSHSLSFVCRASSNPLFYPALRLPQHTPTLPHIPPNTTTGKRQHKLKGPRPHDLLYRLQQQFFKLQPRALPHVVYSWIDDRHIQIFESLQTCYDTPPTLPVQSVFAIRKPVRRTAAEVRKAANRPSETQCANIVQARLRKRHRKEEEVRYVEEGEGMAAVEIWYSFRVSALKSACRTQTVHPNLTHAPKEVC
jgi:hypothetical protein